MSIVVEDEQFNIEDGEVLSDVTEEITPEVSDGLEESIQNPIPDKFIGKSAEDISNSYTELERELGRKNNEVGELRKLTDDILKQQLDEPAKEVTSSTIDLDDLLENPQEVINKAVRDSDNPRIAALEQELQNARVDKDRSSFESRHTDWDSTLNSSDFQKWVTSSNVRKNLFTKANLDFDYATLDEVFNLYGEIRGASKEVAETKAASNRKKALRNTSVEKGSTGEVTKKVYRRADLIRLKQTEPSRYAEMADDIMLAYQEGRVR